MDDFSLVLKSTGTDLWGLIETAITVAARDHREELKRRRDGIVEMLYVNPGDGKGPIMEKGNGGEKLVNAFGGGGLHRKDVKFCSSPEEEEEEDEDVEEDINGGDGGGVHVDVDGVDDDEDDQKSNVLAIKDLIEDPDQEEDAMVDMLQNLADMDITFKVLQETDIGRHVNGLRKHPSSEVRRLVKFLVRKWKELVDDWVKLNQNETASSAIITDGDSPQQFTPAKTTQNGYHVPEFGYSPNPHTGSSGSDRNNWEQPEPKQKVSSAPPPPPPRREPTPSKQNTTNVTPPPSSSLQSRERQKDNTLLDPERLASARRRLHENYQEAQNAKKQRTIQVMDLHDIPKPKNAFFPRNKQAPKHR